MKILVALLVSLFAFSAQAQTTVERFTVDDEWPAFPGPDQQLLPNVIDPGEFVCTGGGEPVGPFLCEGGNGIILRGTQMISCLTNSEPYDERLEGIAWFDITAIWNESYTGRVAGKWRIVPGACDLAALENPVSYWEGTYTGRRKYEMGDYFPTWITKLRLVGRGFGDLAGQEIKARETVTTYYLVPTPWELLPAEVQQMIGTGPEGHARIKIKSQ